MRLAIATDAWAPQVNGVVRTLTETISRLKARGHTVEVVAPDRFTTIPCPGYPEIRLALAPRFGVRKALGAFSPDIVHISTEGPIGWSARAWCIKNNVPFTTAFHTRFPEYVAARTRLSPDFIWPIMRKFHKGSRAILTATQSLRDELESRGIQPTQLWSRGIDHSLFHPAQPEHPSLKHLKKPILLSVGRVAIEKNLEAFLTADVPGTKVVVGDGPARAHLQAQYPDAVFLGTRHGAELASIYASADVFVFPSKTDTFGLVMLEALATGVPVAGYPVQGPLDIIGAEGREPQGNLGRPIGCLKPDLAEAINGALLLDRADAANYGAQFCWDTCTNQFVNGITKANNRGAMAA
ncbi:glycosyltransferase family 4 protein [Sphingorhabdus sp.]|jgi:glycosyltransferase involved in cell wall biosynthesis|uniref:glycosyltransferase family 4 protein n=1 Tax=Sphingorhabdus sp. TaxID=1902408 RepID=UPI003783799D